MKKRPSFLNTIGIIVAVVVVLVGVYFVANAYLSQDKPSASAVHCNTQGVVHTVIIKDNQLSTTHVTAALCDSLTIVNDDTTPRLIAFGRHDHHEPYDGVTEKLLNKGQSLTVTLDQVGTYLFHDHLHDELQGTFTVTKR